jgi:hypothetical protein
MLSGCICARLVSCKHAMKSTAEAERRARNTHIRWIQATCVIQRRDNELWRCWQLICKAKKFGPSLYKPESKLFIKEYKRVRYAITHASIDTDPTSILTWTVVRRFERVERLSLGGNCDRLARRRTESTCDTDGVDQASQDDDNTA